MITSPQLPGAFLKPSLASFAVACRPYVPFSATYSPHVSGHQPRIRRHSRTGSHRSPRCRTQGSRRASRIRSPSSSARTSRTRSSWSTRMTMFLSTRAGEREEEAPVLALYVVMSKKQKAGITVLRVLYGSCFGQKRGYVLLFPKH